MTKPEYTRLILDMPQELKNLLQEQADMQHRTLNSYIVWLLAKRPKKEKPK